MLNFILNHHWWPIMTIVITIFISLNILTFALYGFDKSRAKKGKRRISEKTLIAYSLLGGGFGAMFGMKLFKHKTKKRKFRIAVGFGVLIAIIVVIKLTMLQK